MVFFTTPELLEIGGLPLVSPFEKPTRLEALRYYRRVVDTYDLQIEFGEQVVNVDREPGPAGRGGDDALCHRDALGARASAASATAATSSSRSATSIIRTISACRARDLPHVSHYYNESHGFYRKRVVIVGGGNSAAETALELYRSGAHVTLVHRHPQLKPSIKYWVRPDIENRIKEGSVRGLFNTRLIGDSAHAGDRRARRVDEKRFRPTPSSC